MIGYFPTLYRDELFYSWIARYHKHSRNLGPKQTIGELFNSTKVVATLDIPSNLNSIYENLKHFQIPSIDTIINMHTFFNYFTYFQKEDVRNKVKEYMMNIGEIENVHFLLGINTFTISTWEYFRYCPKCYYEDVSMYGESYWHLSHQLPKSFYCIKHDELLCDSNIKIKGIQKHLFQTMPNNIEENSVKKKSFNLKTVNHLKMLSIQNTQLLKQEFIHINQDISNVYKYLLQINGYANIFGQVDQQKLELQFIKFYGEEFLELVDSTIQTNDESSWLREITRKHRKAFHPIKHILFLKFFYVNLKDLDILVGKEYKPFGVGPFYCLNPAATHYKEKVIDEVIISICSKTKRPVGTFKCSCGFIYSRKGPDRNQEDEFHVGRIKNFGQVWNQQLKKLAYFDKLNYYQISKILKCDIKTVKKYLNCIENKENIECNQKIKLQKENEWISLIKKNPTFSVTKLRKLNSALYTWHYRNNQKWLKSNLPIKINTKNFNSRVNWENRDQETLKKVQRVIKILYLAEKPIFVNKTRVSKNLDKPSYIEKYLERLPKTKEYLINNIETREQFQLRRLLWCCVQLKKRNEEIVAWKIRRMAGFKKEMDTSIEIMLNRIDEMGDNL